MQVVKRSLEMGNKEKIIVVDDNPSNLITCKNILSETYEVFTVASAGKLFSLLKEVNPGLILLDIEMPVTDGFRTIQLLKSRKETRDIPVVFLTAIYDIPTEIEGLRLGAVDYVTKPFNPDLLLKRVEIHLLVANQQRALAIQNELMEKQQQELNHINAELKETLQQMKSRWESM
jgi:DNA-binding response OmpR family regulator